MHFGKKTSALFILLSLVILSCGKKSTAFGDFSSVSCVSDEQFFQQQVWSKIFVDRGCKGCHNANGLAASFNPPVGWSLSTDLSLNYGILKKVALREINGLSLLLVKPTSSSDATANPRHEGGVKFTASSTEYSIMQEFIARTKTPTICNAQQTSETLQGIILYDLSDALRKASIALAGRIPAKSEEALVFEKGETGLREALDLLMKETAFHTRLIEIFNDIFLTDKFITTNNATRLLLDNNTGVADYPTAEWFRNVSGALVDPNDATSNFTTLGNQLHSLTNQSLAREPLELITYVVENDKPFTEIVTANYTMVNPYSARSYGIDPGGIAFKDTDKVADTRYENFVPVQLKQLGVAIPHAGILTSRILLGRYPNTTTNVNRHRSRYVYLYLLGLDILTLAEQLSNAEQDLIENPTLNNSQCTACHTIMDPVAGLFKNYTTQNRYLPRKWYDTTPDQYTKYKMLPLGMSTKELMPNSYYNNSLQWLGLKISQDDRFYSQVVKLMYKALTGNEALVLPSETSNQTLYSTYLFQKKEFDRLKQNFIKSNYNLKGLIKDIVLSVFYRARNVNQLIVADSANLQSVGVGRLLTPEQLTRKTSSVLNYTWATNSGTEYLLNQYRLLYGGIDSDQITLRASVPNAIISNIQMLLASQVACEAVPRDFAILNKNNRVLFPFTEMNFEPEFASGLPRGDAVNAIRKNIQHLHKRILAEDLTLFDTEIDRSFNLFLETYRELKLLNDDTLHSSCQFNNNQIVIWRDQTFTLRAWMAVVTYLMSDYRFVFE